MKLKLKTKPYDHQLKATKRALKQGSHAFFFEPRCGKTKAALDTIAIQHHRGLVQKVVVVAPLIALDVWVGQITEHLAVPAKVLVTGETAMLYWPSSKSSKKQHIKLQIFLVNYDKFSRRGEDEAYRNCYLRSVERWDPDVVVLDESHRVKSAGAVRSQALWRMVNRLRRERGDGRPWVFLLTGTPNPKGYIDLFSQFRILDDTILGTAKAGFEELYCQYGFGKRRYTIIAYRNKAKLLKKIRRRSSIVTSKQAGLDGKQFFNPIRINLPSRARESYEELAEEFLTELEDGEFLDAPNAGVRRLRLLQLTGGFTTDGREIHGAKVRALRDFLSDLREQDEPVVVYARFLAEVAACAEACRRVGYQTSTVTGGTKRRDRSEAIATFQGSSDPRALVFQVETGSISIELSRAADVVFYSLPDSWGTFYQCLERVRGPKQKRPVRHSFIIARNTVDQSVLETLREKRDMHAEMMRHPRGFLFGL